MGSIAAGNAAKKGADMNAWAQETAGEQNAKLVEQQARLIATDARGNAQRLAHNKNAAISSVEAGNAASGLTGSTLDTRSVSVAEEYETARADMVTAAAREVAKLTNDAAMGRWQAKVGAETKRFEGRAAKSAGILSGIGEIAGLAMGGASLGSGLGLLGGK